MTALSISTGAAPVRTSRRPAGRPRSTAVTRPAAASGVSASPAGVQAARTQAARTQAARVHGAPGGEVTRGPAAATGAVRGALHATVRGRRVVLGLIVVVSAGLGLLGGQAVAATPAVPAPTERVVVAPGDTLWELALGRVGPGEDIRDVVLEIQELNGLGSAALSVGDELVLPAA